MDAEVIIVIGANPTINHPLRQTISRTPPTGAKLIVMARGGNRCRATLTSISLSNPRRCRDAERDAQHHHHRGT